MTKPVVVIGAGPAGLACAAKLVFSGRQVVIIDDNLQAGGQYFRQLPPTYNALPQAHLLREAARARHLMHVLNNPLVTHFSATTAWASPQALTISYAGAGKAGRINASALVIATGAQDAPFPFPGWTLPGVISAGGCLNLAKGHGLVPGGKVVVVGNGPLVLVAAATLAAAGAQVTHVVEAQGSARTARIIAPGVFYSPAIFIKGLGYRARLLRSGTKFLSGSMIVRAIGEDVLEGIEIAPVGSDGRPASVYGRRLEAETLVTGYGLIPCAEFARLVGCRMVHSFAMGGWVPERTQRLETSVPNVYAVGDGAGIGGVEIAMTEGLLVGEAILSGGLGGVVTQKKYRRLDRFRHVLADAYRHETRLAAADEDTIICRCEDLRLSDLRMPAKAADNDLGRLKSSTRLGMGRCQGRNCLTSAALLLNFDRHDAFAPLPRARPPIRPVRVRDLISDESIGAAREPDEIATTSNQESCS